jgi:hypothetical protein
MNIYDITPVSKPRMTQRDRWHKRPMTAAALFSKPKAAPVGINIPESGYHITFIILCQKLEPEKSGNQRPRTSRNRIKTT